MKYILIISLFIIAPLKEGQCQLLKILQEGIEKTEDAINKTGDVIDAGTRTARKIRKFKKESDRTTEEFNKNVKVENGKSKETETGDAKAAKITNGEFKNVDWEPVVFVQNEIFPSAIVSLASYRGDYTNELKALTNPIGFRLESSDKGFLVNWEIECADKNFFDKVSGAFVYNSPNQETLIMPDIPWDFNALVKNRTSKGINVTYRFFDDRGKKIEKVHQINVRSIEDCLFYYRETNLDVLFTAYAQENHPEIDEILRKAIDTKYIESIGGYQGSAKDVKLEVMAIWKVLHDMGFQYSSISTPSSDNQSQVFTQSVRTFDKAIKTKQANCIDGSVVLASILRKIGIDCNLIMVPGHAFLSYYTDKKRSEEVFLETTMLGIKIPNIENARTIEEELIALEYYFDIVCQQGENSLERGCASNPSNCGRINMNSARKLVNPIPLVD